ncbi:MAG: flagellar biosynthesis protein FlhF [bacterium]|nr:flagellar biosynthesis protein FlhF [bacterium]
MQIKKYVASTIQEALRQVKKELGPEALILSVNNIGAKAGPLALLSPARVEVTAAIDEDALAGHPPARYPASVLPSSSVNPSSNLDLGQRVKSFSPASAKSADLDFPSNQRHSSSSRHLADDLQRMTQGAMKMAKSMRGALISTLCGRHSGPLAHANQKSDLGPIASLCQILKNIGLQEDIVEHIFDVLTMEIPQPETYTSLHLEELAKGILSRLVKTSGPIKLGGSRKPKYVALVGPTGTGKTTTIAKLSAELLLKRKKKVGLITIDTYRIGAVEQLNTYASIMNIPVVAACTFEQMRKALLQYQDQDIVLIDTAGFSHHDQEHLQLLSAFMSQLADPEIHLVLSINTNEKELINISQKFSLLRYERLLFTKLDESSYPGTIFNHMVYTGKPISYITTGQRVPEDIEVATPGGIINLLFRKSHPLPSVDLLGPKASERTRE